MRKYISLLILAISANLYSQASTQASNTLINNIVLIQGDKEMEMSQGNQIGIQHPDQILEMLHSERYDELYGRNFNPRSMVDGDLDVEAVNSNDSLALVAFYTATSGPEWTNSDNWLIGTVDTWHGVGLIEDRVRALSLYNNNLTGQIPDEIYTLTALEVLSLGNNDLTGSISPSIGNLTNLGMLRLWYNRISGEIPDEIYSMTGLYELSLNGNELSGAIPSSIGNLVNLASLNLSNNNFSGELPAELYHIESLWKLALGYNDFTNVDFSAIGLMSNLARVYGLGCHC